MTVASEDGRFQVMLGVKLKAKRMRAAKTLSDAGEIAGVHLATVSRYENGQYPVPPATLMRLAGFYGCKVADFFAGLSIKVGGNLR